MKQERYIDNELTAATDKEAALLKTQHIDEICDYVGMPNKGWTFTGDERKYDVPLGDDGEGEDEKVLGMPWKPKSEMFKVKLKLGDHKEERTISKVEQLGSDSKFALTSKAVLSGTSRIFDHLGLICPVVLQAKLLMTET